MISVIDAALETVRPAAEAKDIRLTAILDPAAGPVLGDAVRLQQVVWNLLSNAIKFTPRQGRVDIRLERTGSAVTVEIRDSGQGIPAEFLPHVFARFSQADTLRRGRPGGLGLGLAIVRHVVELHGGEAAAESAGPNQGAIFRVKLPIRPAVAQAQLSKGPADELATSPLTGLHGVRVLVVEDDPDARGLIRTLLEAAGASVLLADSVDRALAAITRGERPDVIVSDIGFPGVSGYDMIQRLRALPPEEGGRIPAAALTAYARAEDRASALALGFQAHVTKPVDPAELVAVVARLAGR
jgi:CheY-like chemotaxis protein